MNITQDKEITFLLVDDDEGHSELVQVNLERSGVSNKILRFGSGYEVMEFIESTNMTEDANYLILLDLNMPGMTGYQVLKSVRKNGFFKKVPVIILTTSMSEKEVELCYEAGCNFFMTKPIDYDQFSKVVHDLGLFLKNAKIPGTRRFMSKNEQK